jgi:16S rRNA (guanine(1405)-N(7))-methyltransferase
MNEQDEKLVQKLVDSVWKKPVYRSQKIPEATLHDLAVKALERQSSPRLALKTVRRKLHQISAPYLGDPDYALATAGIQAAFITEDPTTIQNYCREILSCHTSTRERLLILDGFYARLFEQGGRPASILDLACGLNPLTWRWMGLPSGTRYRAYDIHAPRLAFLNEYFHLEGIDGEAIMGDILVDPPVETADVAFLFKEAHRFEERESGCNRALWRALNVKRLYISLPPVSMTGRHDLTIKNRKLVERNVTGEGWHVSELTFANEQVFVIEK